MIEKQYIAFTTVHRKDAFLNEMRNFTKRDRYDPECEAYPASDESGEIPELVVKNSARLHRFNDFKSKQKQST